MAGTLYITVESGRNRDVKLSDEYVWTFAIEVAPAHRGTAALPGEAVEKICHADI
jgi:hypothetical protein